MIDLIEVIKEDAIVIRISIWLLVLVYIPIILVLLKLIFVCINKIIYHCKYENKIIELLNKYHG